MAIEHSTVEHNKPRRDSEGYHPNPRLGRGPTTYKGSSEPSLWCNYGSVNRGIPQQQKGEGVFIYFFITRGKGWNKVSSLLRYWHYKSEKCTKINNLQYNESL